MFSVIMFLLSKSQGQHNYSDDMYPRELLHRLDDMRKNGHLGFCDVTLRVEGHDFTAHRNVLASCSDYFFAMFNGNMKESREKTVHLSGIDPEIMKHVLRYIYTGEILLHADNVECVLQAANLMLIKSLKDACCRFLMSALTVNNCLGMQRFAETYACSSLYEVITMFIHENFGYVTQTEEFLMLSRNQLVPLISSDELSVLNEEKVYEALIRWVKQDPRERKEYFPDLIEHIRLPMMSADYLIDQVESEPLFAEFPKCRDLLTEAHHFLLLPSRRGWFQTARARPRKYESTNEIMIACGGNGEASTHSTVFAYNLIKGTWSEMPRLIPERGYHGVSAIEGDMYVVGGFTNPTSETMDSGKRFSVENGEWEAIASMHSRRSKMSMVECGGMIYVMGGFDGSTTVNSVECYNPTTNRWRYVAPMITRRRCTCAVSIDNFVYVIGGHDGAQILNTIEKYDTERDTWSLTDVAPMSERRSFPCAITLNDDIFVMGGYDGNDTLRTCEIYNAVTNEWSSIEPMNVARSNAGATYLNRKIFVVGGWDGVSLSSVEYYDLVTHEWARVTNLPRPTTGIRCCILIHQSSNEQKPRHKGNRPNSCVVS